MIGWKHFRIEIVKDITGHLRGVHEWNGRVLLCIYPDRLWPFFPCCIDACLMRRLV